jgi:hypothetical protein
MWPRNLLNDDDTIIKQRISGRSVRAIAKEQGRSRAELPIAPPFGI